MKKRYLGIMVAMLFIAFVTTFNYGGCGGGGGGSSSPRLFASGTVVASALPASTSSPDSPNITLVIVDNNVVAPGDTIDGTITVDVPNANLTELLYGEQGASTHNVSILSDVDGLTSVSVNYSLQISSGLKQEVVKKCYFEVRDATGNVSNYMLVQFVVSSDSQYAVTAYGGDNPPNLDGTWYLTHTIMECDSDAPVSVGQQFYTTMPFVQTGNNVSYSADQTTGSGIITGEGNFFSMIVTQSTDYSSLDYDVTVTLLGSFCGEMTSSTTFTGQTNSIVKSVIGPDAQYVIVYPVSTSVTGVKVE